MKFDPGGSFDSARVWSRSWYLHIETVAHPSRVRDCVKKCRIAAITNNFQFKTCYTARTTNYSQSKVSQSKNKYSKFTKMSQSEHKHDLQFKWCRWEHMTYNYTTFLHRDNKYDLWFTTCRKQKHHTTFNLKACCAASTTHDSEFSRPLVSLGRCPVSSDGSPVLPWDFRSELYIVMISKTCSELRREFLDLWNDSAFFLICDTKSSSF